jgi:hypothetical protein
MIMMDVDDQKMIKCSTWKRREKQKPYGDQGKGIK